MDKKTKSEYTGKFKQGEKVKYVFESFFDRELELGKIGVIEEIDTIDPLTPYLVDFTDDAMLYWLGENELEALSKEEGGNLKITKALDLLSIYSKNTEKINTEIYLPLKQLLKIVAKEYIENEDYTSAQVISNTLRELDEIIDKN